MKRKFAGILTLVAGALIVGALFAFKHPSITPSSDTQTIKVDNIENEENSLTEEEGYVEAGNELELSACNPAIKNNDSKSALEETLKLKQGEVLQMTEYHMTGGSGEKLIVQKIPSEESKNQVRVFKIAEDGLPDRIKDFPNATGTMEERLSGALTLGTIQNQIEKFKATGLPSGELTFDREKELIVNLEYINGRTRLTCYDQICECESW